MHAITRSTRTLFTCCALSGVLFTGMATAKDWTTVRVATEGAYEPWNSTLPNGEISGFEPELLKDLCARIQLECKLQAQDWDGMIAGMNAGKFDMLMDAIVITPERQAIVDFSRPYAATQGVFVSATPAMIATAPSTQTVKLSGDPIQDQAAIEKLKALVKGKTIGIQSGTAYTDFVEKNFKGVATIRTYKKSGEHMMDLNAGRIDFAFDDVTFFSSALQNPENQAVQMVGPKIGGPIWGPGEALAFRKSDADLKARFNQALSAALADGTVKKLSEKWFKADIAP
ncbi:MULTISPECIES: transporter substrate-binding domain-containing protein [Pseudomonas]|uniref:Transporter substrate-binding domain-containing protein n=1 Tax=Pseudomonas gingeri TaxID=117681 RepID=A0A7Y8BQ56_9PSED|nr:MULTISPECIES: transporter substrate-binding domain-containing protein [Pseudomonas]MPQ68132.1 transporter substrate-binding domain-containing protein [Pseudomonas sp. MWU12-2323]NWB84210.1 transporter substrate-binding domain-containing protein [Pseudomonas gingeri]